MASARQRAAARRNIKKARAALGKGSRRVRRRSVRRVRSERRVMRMASRRGHKHRMSALKAAGLGIGTYFGLTLGHAQDPMAIAQDPMGATVNLFTAITGFDPATKSFNIDNFGAFWLPVASFYILDVVAKKLLHHNVKLTKDISLF